MIALNTQPAEKYRDHDGTTLDLIDVFSTIQGEGPLAGRPAVFVRTAGCDMQCPGCDTVYTGPERRDFPVPVLVELIRTFKRDLIVLTGGEPFRQNIAPFIRACMERRWTVQIETNGTMWRPELETPWGLSLGMTTRSVVVCSPKSPKVHDRLRPQVTALKYVIRADHVNPVDGLPSEVLGYDHPPARPWPGFAGEVFVGPADEGDPEKNARNLKAAVHSCLKFGYRLNVQIHKECNLP
jgi:7-carboxy-7-deazaguanine synthase